MDANLQYFDMYLHNKHISGYVQILVTGGRFMISYIEGHSKQYCLLLSVNIRQRDLNSDLHKQIWIFKLCPVCFLTFGRRSAYYVHV